jgi:tryptophan synthase alpha chain
MDRIAQTFQNAQKQGRSCFIAYLCAGDPNKALSLELGRILLNNGVDILELGVPFSDPLADGLTNQLAAQRALESGMRQTDVFDIARTLRAEFPEKPIIFYTYYNLVFAKGIEAYAQMAAEAGVDGLLTLDLPPEESQPLLEACKKQGLKNIYIIAPTTPPERMGYIAQTASGFIYYVSREGVTGVRASLADNIASTVAEIRRHTALPVVVGFGISTREQVSEVGKAADGVVVGSALVNCIAHNLGNDGTIKAALETKVKDLVAGLR